MRIHELLDGYPLQETESDDQGTGPNPNPGTPLTAIAAPGTASIADPEFTLAGLKPLRRLKHLNRSSLDGSRLPSPQPGSDH
jgi:hypothetical protein